MRRGMGKRILSLLLALELLCTPLAMARAEDPAQLREETPLGEEAVPAQAPAAEDAPAAEEVPAAEDRPVVDDVPAADDASVSGDTPVAEDVFSGRPTGRVSGGAGESQTPAPVSGESIFSLPGLSGDAVAVPSLDTSPFYHLGLSYGQPYNTSTRAITLYNGELEQESNDFSGWGYGGGVSKTAARTLSLGSDRYLYFYLPDMGRIPDLELEGLYLYAGAEKKGETYADWVEDASTLRSWSYDENHPENYEKLMVQAVAPDAAAVSQSVRDLGLETVVVDQSVIDQTVKNLKLTAPDSGTYTLVRFPVDQVNETLAYLVPADEDVSHDRWSVPVVARWVPSDESDMVSFALDVSGVDSGGAATVEPVTDLFTKPFREAGTGDHLMAQETTITYAAQTDAEIADGKTTHDETRAATVFTPPVSDGGAQHYYLRVQEERNSVTLRFWTQEPYYTYHTAENGGGPDCPVTVTAAFAGKNGEETLRFGGVAAQWAEYDAETATWVGDGQPYFPPALVYGGTHSAQNTVSLPARGQWTAVDIPLQKVSEAADAETDPFNTITVTVTSPDKSKTSTYVFHIERLMTPEKALGNGNSPVGMIMRDNSALWDSQVDWGVYAAGEVDPDTDRAAYNRASAVNYFKNNRTFRDMPILPTGTANQSGAIYKGEYPSLAWYGISNPDFAPETVVAYQDMAFDDPGVSFVDSEGRKVVFGDGATGEYKTCVTRTLELKTAAALSAASYDEEGTTCWYTVDETGKPCLTRDRDKAAQTLRRADGSDEVDLRGLIVLPGVYKAVYTFTDPVSDDELTAERTVVVLPIPGDVDMDGAVTAADAAALDANAATWSGKTGSRYSLLRNRVYGMNTGNNSAMLNADTIRRGFQPALGDSEALGYSDYLYLPLPHTGSDDYHARKTWSQVTDLSGSGAKLRLDFLGIEQGTWNKTDSETYTNNISGPWNSPQTSGDNPGVSIVPGNGNTGTGDVFWMGVYVEDPGTMTGTIKDLSISLVYDSEYVQPAVVHAAGQGSGYDNELNCWQVTTLVQYNFLDGSKDGEGNGKTIFSGRTGSDYTYSNSVLDRPYATHYSKVEGELELAYTDAYGHLSGGKLKEVVFSLQAKSGATVTLATMKKGYLLVLPFQLIRHPDARMGADKQAQLIELSAGMRDFSIVLESSQPAQLSAQGIFSLFSADTTENTYAFSAQDDIYGNTTRNIRAALTYDADSDLVPIGVDNTVRTTLKDANSGENAVYDEPFRVNDKAFFEGTVTAGELPPGLELYPSTMEISGTPTRAGQYEFTIKGIPYKIIVEPRTIHYWAEGAATYYGESEYRGTSADREAGQRNFTFTYDRADLAGRDWAAAKNINAVSGWSETATGQGSAEELAAILTRAGEENVTYTAPTFKAVTDGFTPVAATTGVGKYSIVLENAPATTNYVLEYDTANTGKLSIERRPVWVSHLVIPQDRSGSSIYNDERGTRLSLTAQEQAGEQLIFLTFNEDDANLKSDGKGGYTLEDKPLTGSARVGSDTLTLKYVANYTQNDDDLAYEESQGEDVAYRFLLNANEEPRLLAVESLGSEGFIGANAENYILKGGYLLHAEMCEVYGTVIRRGVKNIEFTSYPYILGNNGGPPTNRAYYGDKVDDQALYVKVTRGAGDGDSASDTTQEYVYNNPLLQPMEIHYNWVSPEEKAAGEASPDTIIGTGWDPDLPKGEQDLRPFNGTDILTPDLDGYYLCAAVKKYEADLADEGTVHYVKVYSDYPIQVSKRTITLTAQGVTRYYGEDNGALHYTYNSQNMIPEDIAALKDWVKAKTGSDTLTLDGGEMEEFFQAADGLNDSGFTAPTMEVSTSCDGKGTPVDASTGVGGGEFYIILKGAASTNYDFLYVRPTVENGVVSTTQTETVGGEGAFGFSILTMLRRPILVQDIYSDAEKGKSGFETIYADTKNLFLQNQTAGLDRVDFALPRNDGTGTYFYRYQGSGEEVTLPLTYADANAVVNGDELSVRYSVRFMCDDGHYRWNTFDSNYYDVTALREAGGAMEKDVVVADLELSGPAAGNYMLVYDTAEQALQRAPSHVTGKNYPDAAPSIPTNLGRSTRYLIHGTGTVILRRISALELQRVSAAAGMECVGQTRYTYGDNYAPYTSNEVSGAPLTLVVRYETDVDQRHQASDPTNKDYDQNVHEETLTFKVSQGVSNFTQRGMTIYYLKPGQTKDQAIQAGQILDYTAPMLPGEHDGAQIFITGKRRVEDATVISTVSESTLQVTKRPLTLTVRDAHRYYGETLHINAGDELAEDYTGTADFTYTFPTAQLALRDREALAACKGVEVAALPSVSAEADLKLLQDSGWDMGDLSVSYDPDPGVDAPVNGESWGTYPIGITPGALDNYDVTGLPGTLYVYPRPVQVANVASSATDPVYTIYNQTSLNQFTTQLDTSRVELARANRYVTSSLVVDTGVRARLCGDDIYRDLPLVGDALVAGESLIFTVRLWFYNDPETWNMTADAVDRVLPQVRVTFQSVKENQFSKNYALTNVSLTEGETFWQDDVYGQVKLRTIDEIFITGKPRTEYTYGEALSLDGLQVTIRYKAHSGETTVDTNTVDYVGPDDFKAAGLYVNYWDPADAIPGGDKPSENDAGEKDDTTTDVWEDLARKDLPGTYRRADTGDHLTIAPTHDTQQYVGTTSNDHLRRPFAANGKYLIISAFQEGEDQTAAVPKVLGGEVITSVGTGIAYEGEPISIVVHPRQLRYDLSATDKTYDGTTQTAGTLTLKNVFDATAQVKVQEGAGQFAADTDHIRDVVYVPVGAAYEGQGDDQAAAGYDGYRSALRNGVVSFTTGTYRPGGQAPLMENGRIEWAEVYTVSEDTRLTFAFPNPNVHYLEAGETSPRGIGTQALADYWRASQSHNAVTDQWDVYGQVCAMPVEVTGMTLAGPDAANYTWATDGTAQRETRVTITTRAAAENGQAAAPYATIHKANRAAITSMAGEDMALPYLQVDEHTNVVRLVYDQDLAAMRDSNNAAFGMDEFRDELHFEYALYYENEDGLFTHWAGATGSRAYQDTTFFGGEFVRPPQNAAYLPPYDDLPTAEDAGENFVSKGQRYQWAEEDTGVSQKGRRESAGVVRDWDAYPGGAERAEEYYGWYYDLYTWGEEGLARTPLPRDTVFYPLVRLSETHNYNASGCLSGDLAVTAEALDAAQRAVAKLAGAEEDETLTTDALAASAAVFSAAAPMGETAAVKTFRQRLDLLSASLERSGDSSDGKRQVQILEDVWFTDTLSYPEKAGMDAVVRNSPTRYYDYYWDADMSAPLPFGSVDFDTVMTARIYQRQSDGSTAELRYTYDPALTGHTAQIYVQTHYIVVDPDTVDARVGDEPIRLNVTIAPDMFTPAALTWTSSDPAVVAVSQEGELTFLAAGDATVTVTTDNALTATTQVHVRPFYTMAITPGAVSATAGDDPVQLSVAITPAPVATSTTPSFTWASSDPAVVTVSQDGTLNFLAAGDATITVTAIPEEDSDLRLTATAQVHVEPVRAMAITPGVVRATVGDAPLQLSAAITPALTPLPTFLWTTSDPFVVTVDQSGLITFQSEGDATITVATADGRFTATAQVHVEPVRALAITPGAVSARVGDEPIQLTAAITPEVSPLPTFTWTSSDPAVVTVSQDGELTFLAPGDAVVTLTTDSGLTAAIQVHVEPAEAQYTMAITPEVVYARLGDAPRQLSAVFSFTPSPLPSLTWTSSNPDVVTVDQSGLITFRSVGSAVILLRDDSGLTATARVYVQPQGTADYTTRINPSVVYARTEDDPLQLRVVITPALAVLPRFTWTSSNPAVVTVDQSGLLTFRGEGSAIITVVGDGGLAATVPVTVSELVSPISLGSRRSGSQPGPVFNYDLTEPWATLDEDYAFHPQRGMTRGELVTLLDHFLTPSDQWQATQELAYIDVTGREKYYEALKRLTKAGVVVGIPNGTFAGDQLATRAEFVAMLSRMLQLDIVDTRGMAHAFADSDETSTWAYAYIDALAKAGAIQGVGGGDFAPNRVITREETAAILARLLTAKLDLTQPDLLRPSDMTPENWSYPAVLRAINTVAFPD